MVLDLKGSALLSSFTFRGSVWGKKVNKILRFESSFRVLDF